jgi:competence protein ComEA
MKNFSLGQQRILFVFAILLFVLFYFTFYHTSNPPSSETTAKEVAVEVTGEIRRPGIYFFQAPPTLKEAIDKAGGLKEAALFDGDSSAEVLETGTQLKIVMEPPKEIKVRIGRMEAHKLLVFFIPLDLNRVSVEDLCLVPGIGESLAREIVAYRERRKAFRSVDELRNVKGIGEKKWQALRNFFTAK